jgi:subtilisin family serine protease
MKMRFVLLLGGILFPALNLLAINPNDSLKYINWQNLDPKKDKAWGISTDRAYEELLKGKTSKTVIVAVIDNGVDINHDDLKDHIWVNEDEIPGNGIDDDQNGYIDDVHGWNFLGNSKGENIKYAPLEVTRLYSQYLNQYGLNDDSVKKYDPADFDIYKKATENYLEKSSEVEQQKFGFDRFVGMYNRYDGIVKNALGKDNYTDVELKSLETIKKTSIDSAKRFILKIHKGGLTGSMLEEYTSYFNSRVEYHYNYLYSSRTIIGDNADVWSDTAYGNNNVAGASPDHGTMVSGLIAADRYNNLGIKGVADNVKIMVIRTVPDGDEWDKDVAKAIEYAIDNGAEIINMSFGKPFSPRKEFVDKIVKMAEEHNVLLIHAAGNDSEDNDVVSNFPNQYAPDSSLLTKNWLTIGSTSKFYKKKLFVSDYSNYGKKSVDLFAPGEDIITCSPGNKYDKASGTSFSAPMVTGAAALIKSYYPNLTASELKDILLQSATCEKLTVLMPGTEGKSKKYVPFSSLSVTGGLLNVYAALQLAEKISSAKK